MKAKNFRNFLEVRLGKNEISEIEQQAECEAALFKAKQNDISKQDENNKGKE